MSIRLAAGGATKKYGPGRGLHWAVPDQGSVDTVGATLIRRGVAPVCSPIRPVVSCGPWPSLPRGATLMAVAASLLRLAAVRDVAASLFPPAGVASHNRLAPSSCRGVSLLRSLFHRGRREEISQGACQLKMPGRNIRKWLSLHGLRWRGGAVPIVTIATPVVEARREGGIGRCVAATRRGDVAEMQRGGRGGVSGGARFTRFSQLFPGGLSITCSGVPRG